jgi:hypothetical protein
MNCQMTVSAEALNRGVIGLTCLMSIAGLRDAYDVVFRMDRLTNRKLHNSYFRASPGTNYLLVSQLSVTFVDK